MSAERVQIMRQMIECLCKDYESDLDYLQEYDRHIAEHNRLIRNSMLSNHLLMIAVEKNDVEAVKELLKYNDAISNDDVELVKSASEEVKVLLREQGFLTSEEVESMLREKRLIQ